MLKLLRKFSFLFASTLLALIPLAQPTYAVSKQREGIERYPFYDKTAELVCDTGNPPTTGGAAGATGGTTGGGLYFLGDSIGVGLKTAGLESQLAAQGYSPTMNVSTSRSIAGKGIDTGFKTSGLEAVDTDADKIRNANTIIIELGTNPENNFAANLDNLTTKIKGLNPNAKIYLIDVAASPQAAQRIGAANTNKAIYAKAAGLGTNVVSRFKIYYPNSDPQTYLGATSPALPFDSLGVHSVNTTDYQKLNDVVKVSLGTVTSPPTASSACCPPAGILANTPSAPLTGNSNMEKIYNYLRSKGLSFNQAVGILGNMKQESDFNPNSLNSIGAFGIAQWYAGRRTGLKNYAASRGLPENDIGMQLDYLWQELTTSYKSNVLDKILAVDTIENTTSVWLRNYEVPCVDGKGAGCNGEYVKRLGFANSIARQLGGAGAVGSTNPGATNTGTTVPNCTTGTTSTIGGDIQNKIVSIAQQELAGGASEKNGGYLKYTDGHTESWCADFVSWVLNKAGAPFTGGLSGGWRISYVPTVKAWFQSKNQFKPARSGYVPKPGDIIIMSEGFGPWPSHVAVVTAVNGKSIDEIGGNQATYYITKNTIQDYDANYITGYGLVGP